MSGHSHWRTIKYKKGAADAQKSKAFSKLARLISIAAKEGGVDPNTNSKLRIAIDQAKRLNMPSDNIERAIKRGSGGTEGSLEKVLFEALGPDGVAIIIEGITDNKNRVLGEIKQILARHNSKLVSEGSLRWRFEQKGILVAETQAAGRTREDIELTAIDAGAESLSWEDDFLKIYAKPDEIERVKKTLESKGIITEATSLDWVAKEFIDVDPENREKIEKLFEALDENEMVQEIYSNLTH